MPRRVASRSTRPRKRGAQQCAHGKERVASADPQVWPRSGRASKRPRFCLIAEDITDRVHKDAEIAQAAGCAPSASWSAASPTSSTTCSRPSCSRPMPSSMSIARRRWRQNCKPSLMRPSVPPRSPAGSSPSSAKPTASRKKSGCAPPSRAISNCSATPSTGASASTAPLPPTCRPCGCPAPTCTRSSSTFCSTPATP